MHEMAIAQGVLDIARDELRKHAATQLHCVRVQYGLLSGIVPDSLTFAFEMLVKGSELDGACLELQELPVRLRCCACGTVFEPPRDELLAALCPACAQPIGHIVEQGKELRILSMDMD